VKTCAIRYHPFQVCYDHTHGAAPNRPPANETFWVKSSSGSGNVSLDWKPRAGSGRAVVVNADDSRGVTADPKFGVRCSLPWWLGAASSAQPSNAADSPLDPWGAQTKPRLSNCSICRKIE